MWDFDGESQKERDHSADADIGRRIILEWN
jgi:hypothetical protein